MHYYVSLPVFTGAARPADQRRSRGRGVGAGQPQASPAQVGLGGAGAPGQHQLTGRRTDCDEEGRHTLANSRGRLPGQAAAATHPMAGVPASQPAGDLLEQAGAN